MAADPSYIPKIGPDGILGEVPVIAYTEKKIEEEQLQLRKYIEENYSKIRDVERELGNLTLEMKLTAGPRKAALEHLRKKIEISTEKIHIARLKEAEAHKVWEAAAKAIADEEEIKKQLCEDLTKLVHESSKTQLSRLDSLKKRLETLNPRKTLLPSTQVSIPMSESSVTAINIREGEENVVVMTASENVNNANHLPEANEKTKKKAVLQGRVKRSHQKSAASSTVPDWTGAGFD